MMSRLRALAELTLLHCPAFVGLLLLAVTGAALAPVGDALHRPAIRTNQAAHTVLLGAARADQRLVVVGERGIVILSDDQGESWRQVETPVSVTLTGVQFADARHGFIVGHGGTVLATDDGGEHWRRRLDGRRGAQLALEAAEASGHKRAIRAAKLLVADGPDKPLLDLLVINPRRVLVVGAYGLAFYSEDAGQTWRSWIERFNNPGGLHLYAIRRRGERILVVGEQGLARLSEDAGKRFVSLPIPYQGSLFTAELPSEQDVLVAGLRGNIWHSKDAGANWQQLTLPIPASINASTLREDGTLVLVNQAGMVLRGSTASLAPMALPHLPPLSGVLEKPDGGLLLLSINGLESVEDGAAQ
jgi:photosystem II stability/assembly factor-like uncharacterized protein